MLEERDHAVVLRTLAGGAMPTPRSTLDTILAPRALARARHRLDRRRHLRRQRRPRRRLRHRLGHGRLHRRQRGRARGRPRRHAGQRAVDGRRRVSRVEVGARGLRIGGRAGAGRDRRGPARGAARARAVLPAQRASRPKKRGRWPSGCRRSRSSFCARSSTKSSACREETFPNPWRSTLSATRVDGDRRLHPDHPVLLHRRHARRHRVVHHQHARPLRRRRVEGAGHDPVVVGQRDRDDDGRRHRGGDHLRPRRGVRGPLDELPSAVLAEDTLDPIALRRN